LRTATFVDGSAIHGGAPPHEYQHSSNKIAHCRALSPVRCACLYGLPQGQSSETNSGRPEPLAGCTRHFTSGLTAFSLRKSWWAPKRVRASRNRRLASVPLYSRAWCWSGP